MENKFAKLQMVWQKVKLNHLSKFVRATIETLSHGLSDKLLKITPIKSIKSKKFEFNFKKDQNLIT